MHFIRFVLILAVYVGFFTNGTNGWCIESVDISPHFRYQSLGKQVETFLDTSHQLSLNDLVSDAYKNAFQPHLSDDFKFGMTGGVLWLRFLIRNKEFNHLILALDKPFAYVECYLPETGHAHSKYKKIQLGYLQKKSHST